MPSSPITKTIKTLPENWKELEKVMIMDNSVACYFRVEFSEAKSLRYTTKPRHNPLAWLLYCYVDDNPSKIDSWGYVEEMGGIHKNTLDTIQAVFGVSFHDKMGV